MINIDKEIYDKALKFEVIYNGKTVTYEDCETFEREFLSLHKEISDIFGIKDMTKYTEVIYNGYTLTDFYRIISLACVENPMVFFLIIAKKMNCDGGILPFYKFLNAGTFSQLLLFSKFRIGSVLYNPRQSCSTSTLAVIAVYISLFTEYNVEIFDKSQDDLEIFDRFYSEVYNLVPEFFKTELNVKKSSKYTCFICNNFEFAVEKNIEIFNYLNIGNTITPNTIFLGCSTINDNLSKDYADKIDACYTLTDYTRAYEFGDEITNQCNGSNPTVKIKIREHEIFTEDELHVQGVLLLSDENAYRREIRRERL